MSRIPSLKTIQKQLPEIGEERQNKLYQLLKHASSGRMHRPEEPSAGSELAHSLQANDYKSVQEWVRQCYHEPTLKEKVMCAADEILETHGVEAIEGETWIDSFHGKIRFTYCNTGDSYAATLVYDCASDSYTIEGWADAAERMEAEEKEPESDPEPESGEDP